MIQLDLVSCLMVTQAARWRDGMPAGLASYMDQQHEVRELVVVTSDPCDAMFEAVGGDWGALGVVHVEPQGSTLGQLRQVALEAASGAFVATWDDDDISHPERLTTQLAVLDRLPLSEACLLSRVLICDQINRREFTGPLHSWEMTMVARRESVPAYNPGLQLGEDSESIGRMRQVVLLDRPDLYVHVVHPGATIAARHVDQWWRERHEAEGIPARYSSVVLDGIGRMDAYRSGLKGRR